ncbi:MAG: metallophosphoesterase [Clostridia bacterium]|nr:metallophosphoesterase [Clostridia bacterium]
MITALFMKAIALLVSLVIFIPVGAALEAIEKTDAENCLLSATVLSDLHMEGTNPERHKRVGGVLYAAEKADNDLLLLLGDNTMNGQVIETLFAYGLVDRFFDTSTVLVAPGNHDMDTSENTNGTFETLQKRYITMRNAFFGNSGNKVYYSREEKGYKFIVLGGEGRTGEDGKQIISDEQLNWLENELAQAKESGKPCFILNHYLVYGRNGGRSYAAFNIADQNDRLTEILETSGVRTFYFCGHSHYGVNDDSVQTTNNVTYINLPATGNPGNYYPANDECGKDGIGMQMEVYENKVVLRFRNYLTGQWLEGYDSYVFELN